VMSCHGVSTRLRVDDVAPVCLSRGMESTCTQRRDTFATVATLYADLGWSVPTCLENASTSLLEESARIARHAVATRGLVRHGRRLGIIADVTS
jgi:hypothetical protein